MSDQPENQFDFWLGEWDVTWGEDGRATNHVLRIMDDKVIQENFSAPDLKGMRSHPMTRSAVSGAKHGWITQEPILISQENSRMEK